MAGGIAERRIRQDLATTAEGISDEDLLAQFLDADQVASQEAFRVLVGRHGPRVLGICRHILNREHDAEDAFQATFLVLARNGASIRDRCALASWLHEVAYRTALKTRARRSRRQTVERQIMIVQPPRDEPDEQGERASLAELRPVLHEEVTGLPDKYRIPVVLSYLEGKTNEEVAAILNWPVGTVKGRLSRGRALLRSRLTRRGVALSTAMLLMVLSRTRAAAAVVPEALVRRTIRRVLRSGLPGTAASSGSVAQPETSSSGASTSPSGGSSGGPASESTADGLSWPSSRVETDSAASPAQGPLAPSRLAGKDPRSWLMGRLISVALVALTFGAAIFVGGCVSSAAYGGKFPNLILRSAFSLRSALSGLIPSRNAAEGGTCHPDSTR
jgi:RNA polymerase sigma factor (sigma-70 family)